ncbi:MAG: hypothetical protein A3B96_01110 [Candidatus Spechtbacteria bacterium RIFCSPHIGHO2_02_FULL_43_15b]|uniref:Uncharacterized protein n=1 Tax=Candidatus Spechtbacteria bacterium RIFCSPHIGHO2_01_FULL_43_30 TaxID=1802158 RepID=A0A1G2H4B9_9BACT|nr:MAG: hypothetical protein A2827_03510 [Candidatus Spechtbacteria bacterium RIFCSPHIGHO2_01_FULL_43_30]OGZ59013.1 MAG: hypothetical protein A3B96_01110 [Candidatus Spechtbacteria bacterium RIFCSPHIGHO2_02_FULL_43_15b]
MSCSILYSNLLTRKVFGKNSDDRNNLVEHLRVCKGCLDLAIYIESVLISVRHSARQDYVNGERVISPEVSDLVADLLQEGEANKWAKNAARIKLAVVITYIRRALDTKLPLENDERVPESVKLMCLQARSGISDSDKNSASYSLKLIADVVDSALNSEKSS